MTKRCRGRLRQSPRKKRRALIPSVPLHRFYTNLIRVLCVDVQILEHEQVYLDALPSASMYEKSYMHRDIVTHVVRRFSGSVAAARPCRTSL